jgi:hypothetical protein
MKIERKAGQFRVGRDRGQALQDPGGRVGPIYMDALFERFDQPAEASTVGKILAHLVLKSGKTITPGAKLYHEVRAKRQLLVSFFRRKTGQPGPQDP